MKAAKSPMSQLLKAKGDEKGNHAKVKGKNKYLFLFTFSLVLFSCLVPAPSTVLATIAPTEQTSTAIAVDNPTKQENNIKRESAAEAVNQIEERWEKEYEDYFDINFSNQSVSAEEIAETLASLGRKTGKKPALLYIIPRPDKLELLLITPGNKPILKQIPEANKEALLKVVQAFHKEITNPLKISTTTYLPTAQQLYQWMIGPVESDLQANDIDTIVFCVGPGLRSLPLAALQDGQNFLVEKYSLASIPAFKLTDTLYTDLKNARVLAMGASLFTNLTPLPAVPMEISTITEKLWPGEGFLNQAFTLENLESLRRQYPFEIIHLATHAEFMPGEPDESFLQFWDTQLTLVQMRQLQLNSPPVSLLVLSACQTALGDEQAELGFGGLAVNSGVKSALASLWYVSDAGTLALMSEFYQHLHTAPIKAEALRQAQIAMIQGKVRLENGKLQGSSSNYILPAELASLEVSNLSHPFYWAAFAIIGSPW